MPVWAATTAFSDKSQLISGVLELRVWYRSDGQGIRGISDPLDVIIVNNLVSGASSHISIPSLTVNGTVSAAVQYIGDFKQSLDLACHPFDRQTISFDVFLMHPGDDIFSFSLACMGDHATQKASCTQPLDTPQHGFDWGALSCTLKGSAHLYCEMEGIREGGFVMTEEFLPAFLFCMMSVVTFVIAPKLAMPRMSTTMVALLNLNLTRRSIMNTMPKTGESSWLIDSMTVGILSMMTNVFAHVLSARWESSRPILCDAIAEISMTISPCVFLLITLHDLNSRKCKSASDGVVTLLVIMWVVLFVAVGLFVRNYGSFWTRASQRSPVDRTDSDEGKHVLLPSTRDCLQHMVQDSVAAIFPLKNQQLASGFADALRAQWIVSREQLAAEDLVRAATISKLTGLPLALCSRIMMLAAGREKLCTGSFQEARGEIGPPPTRIGTTGGEIEDTRQESPHSSEGHW
eukprot:TRINITY_DN21205_c0_g1_i3.p1 TRINITY_DN21205_c0_g1~~TRINITY_DN21205_c0_g1_i3.p1  ORF type:complete len:516 (+),score=54.28 TRINITY_DN21205_c0_g1_i3:168-1550(+)